MNQVIPIKKLMADKLNVHIYESRKEMGAAAANDVAMKIKGLLLDKQGFVNIIFAAAPSQNEFLYYLAQDKSIDWTRVNGFHMDEYVGISPTSRQSFTWFLRNNIFDQIPINTVHYIKGNAEDVVAECDRYAGLLREYPPDIVCMGIGENAHIAFNDPHTADFNDPLLVKVVTLDSVSRQQQVHDGCFAELSAVPTSAITLTIPALLLAKSIYCIVPGKNKALAAYQTLYHEESAKFPSTSLKRHFDARLYLDRDSAKNLSI
jgi:glucosamine-6-phosphate deaminase